MAESTKSNLKAARKQGRQAMKMSAVARGKDNPTKRAKLMTEKNTSDEKHSSSKQRMNAKRDKKMVKGQTRLGAKKKR